MLSQLSLLERGYLQNMKKMSIRKLDELFDTGMGTRVIVRLCIINES